MELAIDDPIRRAKEYAINPNNYQTPQAPLSNKPSIGEEFTNMAKRRAMEGALNTGQAALTEGIKSSVAPTVGSAIEGGAVLGPTAGAGMGAAAMTAMPYIGAGLLAGKAFGLFNEGGMVGPMSPQYSSKGSRVLEIPNAFPTDQQVYDEFRMYKNVHPDGELTLSDIREILQTAYPPYRINYNTGGTVGPLNTQYYAKGTGKSSAPTIEKIKESYYADLPGGYPGMSYSDFYSFDEFKKLISRDPDKVTKFDQGGKVSMNDDDEINKILDEIEAEEASEMVEGAIGVPMPMPIMRPQMPNYGADKTINIYDMIRPDNAPNT